MTEPTSPLPLGHEAAIEAIRAAYESARMPHAWLITGIEGIGKATLAKHIAEFMLADSLDATSAARHSAQRLVMAETHPDLLILRRPMDERTGEQKATLPVEEVLRIAAFLHKTATHGGWRVVILDEAHALNRFGQNAILKIVEEPPPRTLILLTATTAGALLPTIRSRCRLLPLAPLEAAPMRAILKQAAAHLSDAEAAELIALSGGSIGFALKLLHSGALPFYHEMLAILKGLPQLDVARLHKLADQIARKGESERFDVLTALLIERLRTVVQAEATQTPMGHVDLALRLWDKVRATIHLADTANLDRKLAFVTAMNEIRAGI